MPRKTKKLNVEAVVTAVIDPDASDEDALDELIEELEGLSEKYSGVAVFVGSTLSEEDEDEEEEDDDEDEDEEDEDVDEDEDEEDEEDEEVDEDEEDEDDVWTEAELKRLDPKQLRKIAKDYKINTKGKKDSELIDEILAGDDEPF